MIERGKIIAVGTRASLTRRFPTSRLRVLPEAVLLPGLVNVHTHLELPPLLAQIKSETFPEWVMKLIAAKRSLDTNDYEAAARENADELIRTGTTTIGEICTHGISPGVVKATGLRGNVYHEIISMGPGDRIRPWRTPSGQRSTKRVTYGLSPHAPHTVSETVLKDIAALARCGRLPLAMHVAESRDELRLLMGKKSGFEKLYALAGWDRSWAPRTTSPFSYLAGLGLLSPAFLAVHAVHATDRDIALLKKYNVSVAHCPRSNRETRVGVMALRAMLDAGITVGLGTDSLASAPSLSLWDEMRYALKIHKKDGITARDVITLATQGGAKALGRDRDIGTLEPGKRADIIAVPLPKKDTGDSINDLLRETKSSIMTMIDGKMLWLSEERFTR